MFRPWKVFLSVAVGVAVLPCSAMAAPVITITTPEAGKTYTKDAVVTVAYSCSADAVSCLGTAPNGSAVANGSALDTSTIGNSYLTVTARDAAGSTSVSQVPYSIGAAGDPGGSVPATLNLTLGTPAAFSPFIPGVGQTYSTTLAAQILSTAGDAALTVVDPSDTNTGKLVNGTYTLTEKVQVGAVKGDAPAGTQPTMAPLGGNSAPTQLVTYDGPVNGALTVTFKQAIAATEALRTGSYSKTLTFTLSTTQP